MRAERGAMLSGIVVSVVMGAIAGFCFALVQGEGAVQILLSYQLGGMLAALAFPAMAHASLRREIGNR